MKSMDSSLRQNRDNWPQGYGGRADQRQQSGTAPALTGIMDPTAGLNLVPTLLRLGSRLAECPVYLVPRGEAPSAGLVDVPVPAFCEERAIPGSGGWAVATLRAVDIHHRPELDAMRRELIDDLAEVVGNFHATQAMLGRVDPATGLPNRNQFFADLEVGANAAGDRNAGEAGQVLVLVSVAEAAKYTSVVRALGHDYAEDIVRSGAETLLDMVPFGRKLYHVSPLSFAFLVGDDDAASLEQTVAAVARAFDGPIVCREIPIDMQVGIGVVRLSPEGDDTREALRAALSAAQDSRGSRKGWALYDAQADKAHKRAFSLLADLRRAIETDTGLSLYFQPRIDFRTGRCVGAEALLRWTHPTLGPISPGEFIPLAEATALMSPLTDWVLNNAARQIVELDQAGYPLPMSVNVSPKNLAEAEFVDRLEALLTRHAFGPERFELEFTEGTLASDQRVVRQHLDRIRDLGIDIAIDDFGSGYSNMSYLTQIPAQILKIDQAFVRPMMESEKNQHLVRTIIAMGRGLGYRVVAEGIETESAFSLLADWDCDEAQGYFISRPLPAIDYADWLAVNRAAPLLRA